MSFRTGELERQVAHLVLIGKVWATEGATSMSPVQVRVMAGEILTGWLPVCSPRAGSVRMWSLPSVGEQVVVLCPHGDPAQGVVIGSLFSNANPVPGGEDDWVVDFGAGSSVKFNPTMGLEVVSTLPVKLKAPMVQIEGSVSIAGALSVTGAATLASAMVAGTPLVPGGSQF